MMSKSLKTKTQRDNHLGYLFLAPWLIGFILFTVYPLFYTFYLSFNDVKLSVLGWETNWVGLTNYINTLLRQTNFTPALMAFLMLEVIYVPSIVIVSFILAMLLNMKIQFRGIFRTIYFLPVIVLSGSVMRQLMESGGTEIANVNDILAFNMIYNFSPMFAGVIYSLFQNFSMVLWFTGIPIILFINGLQKIDRAMFEAARIDGATSWQILWKIIVPMIQSIVLVSTIFTVVQLGVFPINPVYGMIQEAIYNTAGGLGLAATYAYLYTLVIAAVIGLSFLILREKKEQPDRYAIGRR